MFAANYISNEIPTLESNKPFLAALSLMDEAKISFLPIVDHTHYLGLLPEHIIYELELFDKTIKDYIQYVKPLSILPHTLLIETLPLFITEKVDVLPVIDESGAYKGVITPCKVMEGLSSLLASGEPGGILVLTMNFNDLYISEIARIVEDEDASIMNLFVQPVPASTQIKVMLKVNKTDISRIKKSFLRYNYDIEVLGKSDSEDEQLSQKYELFMKYLNI